MGRKKVFHDFDIPATVVSIVRAICADYDRRIRVMYMKDGDVQEQYRTLNDAVDQSLLCIECGIRKIIFDDICLGRGYDHSPASAMMAKTSYYNRKKKAIHDIADKLKFI